MFVGLFVVLFVVFAGLFVMFVGLFVVFVRLFGVLFVLFVRLFVMPFIKLPVEDTGEIETFFGFCGAFIPSCFF